MRLNKSVIWAGFLPLLFISPYVDILELNVIDLTDTELAGSIVYGKVKNRTDYAIKVMIVCSILDKVREDIGRNEVDIRINPKSYETFWIVVRKGAYSKSGSVSRFNHLNLLVQYKDNIRVQLLVFPIKKK